MVKIRATAAAALAAFAAMPIRPARANPTPKTKQAAVKNDADQKLGAKPDPHDDVDVSSVIPLAAESETIVIIERRPPGSSHFVGRQELEQFERDDVHKALASVPGVYVRQEDGYGLRPNIGMRGVSAERSAKIALMEDGVLIAPAPYSAPAAYYFPSLTQMVSLEVTKGPGSIAYGPNTVGGALNLNTRGIPTGRELYLDLAGGSDLYGKLHGYYGHTDDRFGLLIEGVKLRTDGFKLLDGGGDTGFDKNEIGLKTSAKLRGGDSMHELSFRIAYADEVSNETYTGLTDDDFASTPYRRYRATQLDRFDGRHVLIRAAHVVSAGRFTLTTTAYRHAFSRNWRKLSGFGAGVSLADVLADPDGGNNAVLYGIVTGEVDSTSAAESLIVGTNERDFLSQGVQAAATLETGWWGLAHRIEVGARLHADEARRFHYQDPYLMLAGAMVASGDERMVTLDATGSAEALAGYLKHELEAGDLRVTVGARVEHVQTHWRDHRGTTMDRDAAYTVLIPGAGIVYQPVPWLGLLAGVHKGFVPVTPGEEDDADPEESINYEAGFRWSAALASAEVIGFYSDYSNLKGTCSFSSGCEASQIDEEFNGGAVSVWGVEATARAEPTRGAIRFPLALAYTLSLSEFQHGFVSANPAWGTVEAGDELPYLPRHQLTLQAGVASSSWELALAGRYVHAMRDVAGQGDVMEREHTDASLVLDIAAGYSIPGWGKAYLTVDNALDRVHMVSRRPYGARPGVPRLVVVGYKQTF